jgi:hypothetical protein
MLEISVLTKVTEDLDGGCSSSAVLTNTETRILRGNMTNFFRVHPTRINNCFHVPLVAFQGESRLGKKAETNRGADHVSLGPTAKSRCRQLCRPPVIVLSELLFVGISKALSNTTKGRYRSDHDYNGRLCARRDAATLSGHLWFDSYRSSRGQGQSGLLWSGSPILTLEHVAQINIGMFSP